MTEKLFYQDAYKTEFTAKVQEWIEDKKGLRVRLDRTAFYPEGGGQGADHGTLELEDGKILQVIDVHEADGEVWHYIEAGDTVGNRTSGTAVTGRIDWARRFDHMQQHSGEHIVSGMICRRFGCDNVGFHLGEDMVTIDFNVRISMEEALEIEEQANTYIWEDHPFEVLWPTAEELKTLEYRSKKELSGDVRIARFPGADTCACCGTHVSGSAQVGMVKFLSAKNFHEGTRLELLCGRRAMEFLSMNYRENKAAAVLLSSSEDQTSEHVKKLLEENLRLKAAAAAMEEKLFRMWAETFRDQGNVLVIDDEITNGQPRALADLVAECCGGLAAVFSRKEDRYNYAVIQKGGEITALIKDMNRELQGRGGGRDGFAQGSVAADRESIERFFQTLLTRLKPE